MLRCIAGFEAPFGIFDSPKDYANNKYSIASNRKEWAL
jgi:hypothetical protein